MEKRKEKPTLIVKRYNDNQQTTVTHFGENKRLQHESSKQKCCIIVFMSNSKSDLHFNMLIRID